jgi:hypothetical protein
MDEGGALPANVDGILSKPPRMNDVREAIARVTRPQTAPTDARVPL